MSRFPFWRSPNPAAPRSGYARASGVIARMVWRDDRQDEDDEDEDDLRIIEDQGDIEIVADDALDDHGTGSTGPAEKQPKLSRRCPDVRASSLSPVETQTVAEPHDGWEPSEEDLDLDVIEAADPAGWLCRSCTRATATGRSSAEADDQPEAEFSLSRSATQRIEELDLAPMVDVAFQLVLFFMVTATMVLYKTLEIPKPSGESPPVRSPRAARACSTT